MAALWRLMSWVLWTDEWYEGAEIDKSSATSWSWTVMVNGTPPWYIISNHGPQMSQHVKMDPTYHC